MPKKHDEGAHHAKGVTRQWLEQRAKEDRLFWIDGERSLWALLKGLPAPAHFVRKHIVGCYIADFASPAQRLIVELTGKYHFAASSR